MRPSQIKWLFALAAAWGVAAVDAAQWQSVAVIKGDRIELDKSRIARQADGKVTAWSRLALDRDFIDEQGMRYTAIEALNRYDCEKRSFATVKRVYRRDSQTVREEAVANVRELAAEPGSADDKLLTEACKPRTVGEAQKVAEAASRQAVAASAGKPGVMYADMRSAESAGKPRTMQVAEAGPVAAKPAEKAAEPKAANGKSGERPRFIELPKIDKSQVEDVAKPAAASPAPGKAGAKPAGARVEKAADRHAEKPVASRQELERLYASSGPRKTPKKKPVEQAVIEHRDIHWSYEGEGSPGNWDKLRADYATCGTGKRQSPIDIRESIKVDLEPIMFDYQRTQFRITDNGHTILVEVGEGSSIRVMERQFQLVQFHFHKPSEERINGKSFDMVAHLVHKDDDGKLAVIAVLLEKGMEHPLIQILWNNMPLERGQGIMPAAVIDLNNLLPPLERRAYYTYMGSLTTPPCSEDVLWMVFKQPVQVSQQQVSIFSRLYSNNARPVQPANGRLVKENR
ncbi:MAG: hypothetical protein A2045_14380 [Rhodocyclales bacterium GWA2_65_20]|nr:MAG: hypothetical protein A2045_14380 [Rhodocyclales bacterium GWA2_65_20]